MGFGNFGNFWLPSILMGVGIAIDVTIATLAKFQDERLTVKKWTLPITGTHIVFPAAGYYSFWAIAEAFPAFNFVLGAIGAGLVGLFVYEVVCKSASIEPRIAISSLVAKLFRLDESDARIFMAILAVSWDALWSGPAKAAQAVAGMWSTGEVAVSFLIAGAVVAIIAQIALFIALLLRRIRFANPPAMARFTFCGKFVELSVIGGFGVLSLWQGVTDAGNLYWSIAIAAVLLAIVFFALRDAIMENELDDAAKAIV